MKIITFLKTVFVLLLCSVTSYSSATDLYLSSIGGSDINDGTTGYPVATLSKALTIAQANDVIHVSGFIDMTLEPFNTTASYKPAVAGTNSITVNGVTYNTWNYSGAGTQANAVFGVFTLSRAITIIGDDKTTCGFDGKNTTCLIRQDNSTGQIKYQNLTFKNGKSADASGGGAMYIRGTNANVTNCEFTTNTSGGTGNVNPGGAITVISGTASITSSRFTGNVAKFGAGISVQTGSVTLDGCTFENNDVSGIASSNGAAIYLKTPASGAALNIDVKNSVFKNNKTAGDGGAICCTDGAAFATTAKFTNCAIISNTSAINGGGVAIYNSTAGATLNLSFINTTFSGNIAGSTLGGAIFGFSALTGSSINLINCTITENKVTGTSGGGGAGVRYTNATVNSVRTIYNTIIENNTGTTEDMTTNINNYIDFSVQGDAYTAGTTLIIDKSYIAKGAGTNFSTLFSGSNTVNYAALINGSIINSFVAKLGAFNSTYNCYPLQSGSPAIDYGNSSYLSSLSPSVATDQVGNIRPFTNSKCYAGAVEIKTVQINSNTNISTLGINSTTELTINSNELIVNQNSTLRSIVINAGAKLTVSSGNTLTATNGISIQSDATGTGTLLDSYALPTLNATVQQYVEGGRNWYMSSPVTEAPYTAFNKGNSLVQFNEIAKSWDAVTSGNLIAGKGYIQVASAGQGLTGIVNFTGLTNSGNVTVTLSRTGTSQAGYNLVGNPYPSYLDWSKVAPANSNILPTAWFRTKNTDGSYTFATVNVATPSSPVIVNNGANTIVSKYIPPMQAYWVRLDVNTLTTNFTVTNIMRDHADNSGNKLKVRNLSENAMLRLQVSNGYNSDETVLYFNPNASDTFDKYDSPKMTNSSISIPELYTRIQDEKLVINGMKELKYDTEIPLGFSTGKLGNFTIKATEQSNFADGTQIIIKDYLNPGQPVNVDLTDGGNYNFSSDIISTTNRFKILFKSVSTTTKLTSSFNDQNLNVYCNVDGRIIVNYTGDFDSKSVVSIYNSLGQLSEKKMLTNSMLESNKVYISGIYLVIVKIDGQISTRKLVIN